MHATIHRIYVIDVKVFIALYVIPHEVHMIYLRALSSWELGRLISTSSKLCNLLNQINDLAFNFILPQRFNKLYVLAS